MVLTASGNEGKTILDCLRRHDIYIPAVCGGKGTCGKCAVRVKTADGSVKTALACNTYVTEDIEVTPFNGDKGFEILTGYNGGTGGFFSRFSFLKLTRGELGRSISESVSEKFGGVRLGLSAARELSGMINANAGRLFNKECVYILTDGASVLAVLDDPAAPVYGLAVDIGTTTVGFELVTLMNGARVQTHSRINRQREFGADVISRILHSQTDDFFALTRLIHEDIKSGINEVCLSAGIRRDQIYKMAVAGNTTMIQLLLGIRCESMGHTPFKSSFTSLAEFAFEEIFGEKYLSCPVLIMPGVSAFIGGDITAGLLLCEKTGHDGAGVLIDIGTNGEMALYNNNGYTCTSTAAGPAFEGGNISCGTGSVPGAVSSVKYKNGSFETQTIGGAPPVGLCGTGAIDLLAALMDEGFIDETGVLDTDDGEVVFASYQDGTPMSFTQKDVREMQLAKSALRAGLETLLSAAGTAYEGVGKVYIAGGFGFKINIDSAVKIGMLPEELKDKVEIIGNSSLGGCVKALVQAGAADEAGRIAQKCREINLSEDKLFNRLFMEYMYF